MIRKRSEFEGLIHRLNWVNWREEGVYTVHEEGRLCVLCIGGREVMRGKQVDVEEEMKRRIAAAEGG